MLLLPIQEVLQTLKCYQTSWNFKAFKSSPQEHIAHDWWWKQSGLTNVFITLFIITPQYANNGMFSAVAQWLVFNLKLKPDVCDWT